MKRIVILGAGYAGLAALHDLTARTSRRQVEIVFVDKNPYHTFVTELHTIAGGYRNAAEVTVPLEMLNNNSVQVRVDTVETIDWKNKRVKLAGGDLTYDYCLVGLGSSPETFGIEGVSEHAYFLNSLNSALTIREQLQRIVQQTKSGQKAVVAIAGGGLTGIELAGEIAHYYRNTIDCVVLEAMDQLIPGFDRRLAEIAETVLKDMGIRVMKSDPIQRVTENEILTKNGQRINYNLIVWTAGVRANPIIAESGLQTDRRGRALVDEYLRSVDSDRLYIMGDCAAMIDPRSGRPLPPTAQLAGQAGRHVADMVIRRLHGYVELPFVPEVKGFLASLGPGMGVGQMGGASIKGRIAWLAKWLVETQHAFESAGSEYVVHRLLGSRQRDVQSSRK